jgi:hypothetical protein
MSELDRLNGQDGNRLLLRPSFISTLGLLLVCTIFVVLGIWMSGEGQPMGWFVAGTFGVGVVIALVHLLPNASYLLLTEDGFETRTLYRSSSVAWDEIAFFATTTIGHNKMVVFNYSDRFDRSKRARRLARAIAGYEGALPDTYGMKADQLASLLNEWKGRFGEG